MTKLRGCKILCARWRRSGAKTSRSCSQSSCRCGAAYSELQSCPLVYLPPLQEEELSDELARQKERDALRKSYIEEMKLRHEQTKTELMQQLTREQALHKEDQSARATCEAQLQTMDLELHDVRKLEADRRERDNQVRPPVARACAPVSSFPRSSTKCTKPSASW
jgi:hypothetical protein